MQPAPRIRLYIPQSLHAGRSLVLDKGQAHYLAHVMRRRPGDALAVFNGREGEWRADIAAVDKKSVTITVGERLRAQAGSPDLWLAFAPIRNKTEILVEKAVELGVSSLLPVLTRHGVVKSVNREKLAAHAVEAAEQCERLDVPPIMELQELPALLAAWPKDRLLLHADEGGAGAPLKTLLAFLISSSSAAGEQAGKEERKYGILIGPEGGFSAEERAILKGLPFVRAFGMGPRILRADTAAIAALACVQAWLGDWERTPAFKAEA